MRVGFVVAGTLALSACSMITGADDLVVVDTSRSSTTDGGADASATPYSGGSTSGGNAPCTPVAYGPKFPGEATGPDWTQPANARVLDGNPAHGDLGSGVLQLKKFTFGVPAGATIAGIQVDVARSCAGLVTGGTLLLGRGAPKPMNAWPVDNTETTFPVTSYGGPTDLWGASWTAAQVNEPAFSVSLSVSGAGDAHVDAVSVTVFACGP